MIRLIIFTLLSFQLSAQTVFSDSFSDFVPDTTLAKFKALYIYDPANYTVTTNYAGTGLDLTANGSVGDSTISGVLVSGGQAIYFDGTDDYYLGGTDTDFDIGTGNMTFHAIVRLDNMGGSNLRLWYKRNVNPGYDIAFNNTNAVIFMRDLTINQVNVSKAHGISDSDFHIISIVVDRTLDIVYLMVDGVLAGTTTSISALTSITGASAFAFGATSAPGAFFKGHIQATFLTNTADSTAEIRQLFYKPRNWVSVNSNVSRDLSIPEYYLTAWSDTLIVPLSDATLGNNQEWVLTSSNIDDVTAWIGSRSSAKSVKKSITGGVSFASNTTYFGDGFSLVGDSLVVVFPADTASIDNIVFKKAQHHLKSPANRGWLGW